MKRLLSQGRYFLPITLPSSHSHEQVDIRPHPCSIFKFELCTRSCIMSIYLGLETYQSFHHCCVHVFVQVLLGLILTEMQPTAQISISK